MNKSNKKILNVMIDLETLGTKPGSAIIAIGAVIFSSPDVVQSTNRYFYSNISSHSNEIYGLKTDPVTLAWWLNQTTEAQENSLYGRVDLKQALTEFSEWLAGFTGVEVRVWGNAASFDLKLLEAAYAACDLSVPWKYYNEMCFRTLKNLGLVDVPKFLGTRHDALCDARHQALWAEWILARLEALNG